jgi:hypothetical protein
MEVLKQKDASLHPPAAKRHWRTGPYFFLLHHCNTTGDEGRADTVVDTDTALNHSSQVLHSTPGTFQQRALVYIWPLEYDSCRISCCTLGCFLQSQDSSLAHAFIRIPALQIYKDCPAQMHDNLTLLYLGDL